MLHHVSSQDLQQKLFHKVWRVPEPGGYFADTDSRDNWGMRLIHIHDTTMAVFPEALHQWLVEAGFVEAGFEVRRSAFRFWGKKPTPDGTIENALSRRPGSAEDSRGGIAQSNHRSVRFGQWAMGGDSRR